VTSTTASFGRTGKQVEAVNYAQTIRRNEATERASSKRAECAEGARGGQHAKTALRYLVAAMACALFALIYAQFSHGVHSPSMTFMFAIPLFIDADAVFDREDRQFRALCDFIDDIAESERIDLPVPFRGRNVGIGLSAGLQPFIDKRAFRNAFSTDRGGGVI
jgi:hypothetical protein